MKTGKVFYIGLLLHGIVLTTLDVNGQIPKSGIYGTIKLSKDWEDKIYLSSIPSLDKMYTMSNDMIVSYSTIKEDGTFHLDTSFLPKHLNLYRLHISKKNSPPASLIIGGTDENHFFLILNNVSLTSINKLEEELPFHYCTIKGNSETISLQKINKISRLKDSIDLKEIQLKREFIDRSIQEELRFIADTSSSILVSLYALEKSDYESNIGLNYQFYEDYLEKWDSNQSLYFKKFKSHFPNQTSSKPNWIVALIIGLLAGILSTTAIRRLNSSKKLKSLSVQERKVLEKLKQGKTNKEISEELTIGISTVKSHVSNILNKLKLKSRKDILDLY